MRTTHLPSTQLEVFTHPETGETSTTRVRVRHPAETLRLQRLIHLLGKSQTNSTHRRYA